MARKSSMESGASASFLDLLCCALGGVILLVVLFSTRIKPGDATDQAEYLVAEFRLTVSSRGSAEQALLDCRPALEVLKPRPLLLSYRRHPDLEASLYDEFDFRWLTSTESAATGTETVTVHLVITNIDEALEVLPHLDESELVSDSKVTLFSSRQISEMEDPAPFFVQTE